jgi:hypothetical protein
MANVLLTRAPTIQQLQRVRYAVRSDVLRNTPAKMELAFHPLAPIVPNLESLLLQMVVDMNSDMIQRVVQSPIFSVQVS